MTRVISGRPARCLANRFTDLGKDINSSLIPEYPIAYDAGKSLNTAARKAVNLATALNGPAKARPWQER